MLNLAVAHGLGDSRPPDVQRHAQALSRAWAQERATHAVAKQCSTLAALL
jgi:hypothetical protein